MAGKQKVNHNMKEKFRHQNLQRLLENVASQVPQPITLKKETKAKKLRRIVLYMKFLLHKRMQLAERPTVAPEGSGISHFEENTEVVKEMEKVSKMYSEVKSKTRHPQIVFLRKSSPTPDKCQFPATKKKVPSCTVTRDSSDARISTENEPILDGSQLQNFSPTSYPTFNGKDLNCDVYPYWSCKMNSSASERPSSNVFKRPWEQSTSDNKTETNNFHPPKKIAPDTGFFENSSQETEPEPNRIVDQNRIYDPEYLFEDPNMDNNFLYGNSELNNVYEREIGDKHAGSRCDRKSEIGNGKDKLPSMSAVSHPAMLYPNLYLGDGTDAQTDVAFLQEGGDFPFEFLSSEESAQITSSGEWFSSEELDFAEKMSQESVDFNSTTVVVGSEDNSVDSINIGKNSCDDNFTETFCDMGQYITFNQGDYFPQGSTMDPSVNFLPDYVQFPGYNNFQNLSHPGLVRQNDIFGLQQNYYQSHPGLYDNRVHPETIVVKQENSPSLQETYYPDAQKEIQKSYPARSVVNSESKYPKMKAAKRTNYFVPEDDRLPFDSQEDSDFFGNSGLSSTNESMGCSSRQQESSAQIGHSSFKIGNECGSSYNEMKIKQEDQDPSLPSEEISYSLNNLSTWYENCFDMQGAQ